MKGGRRFVKLYESSLFYRKMITLKKLDDKEVGYKVLKLLIMI